MLEGFTVALNMKHRCPCCWHDIKWTQMALLKLLFERTASLSWYLKRSQWPLGSNGLETQAQGGKMQGAHGLLQGSLRSGVVSFINLKLLLVRQTDGKESLHYRQSEVSVQQRYKHGEMQKLFIAALGEGAAWIPRLRWGVWRGRVAHPKPGDGCTVFA